MVLVFAVVFGGLALWRYFEAGASGILAAVIAVLICWIGATGALLFTAVARSPQGALSGLLLGILCRMGLPLIAVLVIHQNGGRLVEAGAVVCFLIAYPIGLVAETLLVLPVVKQNCLASSECMKTPKTPPAKAPTS